MTGGYLVEAGDLLQFFQPIKKDKKKRFFLFSFVFCFFVFFLLFCGFV